ncbi:hypothetical protein N0V88_005603 [Collariella sp. IMI 366227]|nr:hypothetical protein N0V88_005603 [Collariella sp. IMI 366227]
MAAIQKAILLTKIGNPVILVSDRPIPQPGLNQVQLKVTVAGLNPHDQRARDIGNFVGNDLPAVLTHDVVGKVTALGQGVSSSGLAIGDRIVTLASLRPGSLQNGLQEYTLADVGALAKIPHSVSDDEAATLPTNVIAPLAGLFGKLKLGLPTPWDPAVTSAQRESLTVLIVGGGSSCGKFALKGFGATHVVGRHGGQDAVVERIRAVVGDSLVYALDAVNGPEGQLLALDALSNSREGALARLVLGPVDESKVMGKAAGFRVLDVFSAFGEDELY